MSKAEEIRREKAKQLRYRKPIVKDLNLQEIQEQLWDIQEECENVRWFEDSDEETLIDALDGDEDEAYEFRMMFADLCAECERMQSDLEGEWVPECFDLFFVAAGAGNDYGGLLGYDSFEEDYFGIGCTDSFAENEAEKRLKQMTKDELIEASRQCFRIFQSYISLRHRYDCLRATMDILKGENLDFLQSIKEIEKAYDAMWGGGYFNEYSKEARYFDKICRNLPPAAWIQ